MKKTTTVFLLTFLLLLSTTGYFFTPVTCSEGTLQFPLQPTDPVITSAISYLKNQQTGSGDIAGISVSAWAAMALFAASEDLNIWETLGSYLKNNVDKLNDEKATDWQRHTLAIIAFGEDPRNCDGVDYLERILSFFDGNQMGNPTIIYDDLFGILALKACGMNSTNDVVQTLRFYVLDKQQNNGGWGDVDSTAITVMALIAIDEPAESTPIQDALSYLETQQTDQGSFYSWGSANTASTAWALGALVAAGEDPTRGTWVKNGHSPVDFLILLQQQDGSFNWSQTSHQSPEWMTAYVIQALVGQPYPVKCWDSGSEPPGSQDDDPSDTGSSDDSNEQEPDPTLDDPAQTDITLISPRDHSLYLFNK